MAIRMKSTPVMPLSHCWKCSNPRLNLAALLTAFCISHAMTMTGMLADKPKMRGTIAPTLLDMLNGIIMPK